ncbi:hypothetical protein [Thermoflexus sp.]|jgi:hypothetical protein|uniref:hypothetical protein n=1 Tax=Thermoflexus sp. TaxID=1969742 RepID=UPI003C09A01A
MSNASAVHVTVFRLTRHDMSPEQAEALREAVGVLLSREGFEGPFTMSVHEHKQAVPDVQTLVGLLKEAAQKDAGDGRVPSDVAHVLVAELVLPVDMLDKALTAIKKAVQDQQIPPCYVIRANMRRDDAGNFAFNYYERVLEVKVETVRLTEPKA